MAAKCLIFTYGLLRPDQKPPRSLSAFWPDRIYALLYDIGNYPGAVLGGTQWLPGYACEIDADELAMLDDFEDTASGEFTRRITETEAGHTVWVYEYTFPVPKNLLPQLRWEKK